MNDLYDSDKTNDVSVGSGVEDLSPVPYFTALRARIRTAIDNLRIQRQFRNQHWHHSTFMPKGSTDCIPYQVMDITEWIVAKSVFGDEWYGGAQLFLLYKYPKNYHVVEEFMVSIQFNRMGGRRTILKVPHAEFEQNILKHIQEVRDAIR